jgi:anti-anti-sigma factor
MAARNVRLPRLVTTRLGPGVFQVTLTGDIDLLSARRLTFIARDFLQSGHPSAVVELRGVTFFDSTGLLLLVRLHRTAVARGGHLTLLEPSEVCMRTLELVGFEEVFEIQREARDADQRPYPDPRPRPRVDRIGGLVSQVPGRIRDWRR